MKLRLIGVILGGAALILWACKGDPTADLRAGPASLNLSPTQVFVDTGATASLAVAPRDGQLNPVNVDVTVSSGNQSIATVALDTSRPFPDASAHAYVISAVGLDSTTINVTGG